MRLKSSKAAAALLSAALAAGSLPVLASNEKTSTPYVEAYTIEEGDQYSYTQESVYAYPTPEEIAALTAPYRDNLTGNGVIGFFLSSGDDMAAAIVARGVNDGIVNLYDPNDCATLQHMKDAIFYLRTANELRARHGASQLSVDPVLMAIAMVQADASRNALVHSELYPVSENLAVGGQIGVGMGVTDYGNPFDLWYTAESIRDYNNGHFLNLIRPTFVTTGFAVGTNCTIYPSSNTIFSQTFSYGPIAGTTYSIGDYETKLHSFTDAGFIDQENGETYPMHRLYNPNSGEHLFTKDTNEKNVLASIGWQYEGIGWFAPREGGEPVYRVYNPNSGDHHYTMDPEERMALIGYGWMDEGIGWYSDPQQRVPLLRQFNPNAVTGTHNYTKDEAEAATLVSHGWIAEDIAWYGVQ